MSSGFPAPACSARMFLATLAANIDVCRCSGVPSEKKKINWMLREVLPYDFVVNLPVLRGTILERVP